MDEDDQLRSLERLLVEAISGGDEVIADEDFSTVFMEMFNHAKEELVAGSLKHYKETAQEQLLEIRSAHADFDARCFLRWKPSFDHLEMMWSICKELGEMHGASVYKEDGQANNPVMAALSHIFPRALLVAQEIICLLKGGYPDGGLTRWRSLHELCVAAMYIAKHGGAAAVAYLVSFDFASRRAAIQMNQHSVRAGMQKFSDAELKEFDDRCANAERILGRKIARDMDGEWPAINPVHKTFAAVEKDVGMDHWRPRYKWASAHTHAHHRPMDKLLGMAEADREAHLVGSSNSGFVDPFQMTAITLSKITITYLLYRPNVDRVVHSTVLQTLADEMSTIAIENERVTRAAYESQRAQQEAGSEQQG